jgi:hypothetical protein
MGRPMLCLEPLCNATLQHESAPLFLLTSHTPTIHISWTIHTIHINNLCYSSPPGVTYIPHIHSLFHGHIQRGSRRQTRRHADKSLFICHAILFSIVQNTKHKPQNLKPETRFQNTLTNGIRVDTVVQSVNHSCRTYRTITTTVDPHLRRI